jgi:short-subunit dehydrogenase
MDFKDKTIIVSGATGGMAVEIVKILSKQSCKLALFSRRENKLKELCKMVKDNGSECIHQKCDVTKPEDIKKAVDYTKKTYGKIDVAILTAGILVPIPIETFNSDLIRDSMEVNFMGNVYFIDELLKIMKKQRSGIIAAVSTLPDKRGVAGWGTYGASKAALSWLLESLRAESKDKYNINIITIKPGSVLTPMIQDYHRRGAITSEKAAEYIVNGIKKDKKVIQFPIGQVLSIRIQDLFPPFAYDIMPYEAAKGDGFPKVEEK